MTQLALYKMQYINVIDESFDTSIDMSEMERFEKILSTCKSPASKPLEDYLDSTRTFEHNFIEFQDLNRKLSTKIRRVGSRKTTRRRCQPPVEFPKYCPPSERFMLAYRIYSRAYLGSVSAVPPPAPRKPKFPKAKTNTNLAMYIHKLYIYEQYLKTELKKYTLQVSFGNIDETIELSPSSKLSSPSRLSCPTTSLNKESPTLAKTTSGSLVTLKHEFHPNVSLTIARSLSKKSCRAVTL